MQKWISSHVAKDNVGQKSKGLGNRHTAPCLCYRHESKPLESHIYPSLSSPSINGYSNSFTGWSPLFVILGWKVLKKSKLGQIKGCPSEGASGCQIHHSLGQVFQNCHSISTITVKQHSSLPELSSAQEPQKCLLRSCETSSDWNAGMFDFCIAAGSESKPLIYWL